VKSKQGAKPEEYGRNPAQTIWRSCARAPIRRLRQELSQAAQTRRDRSFGTLLSDFRHLGTVFRRADKARESNGPSAGRATSSSDRSSTSPCRSRCSS